MLQRGRIERLRRLLLLLLLLLLVVWDEEEGVDGVVSPICLRGW
jgi:hypothetical protein